MNNTRLLAYIFPCAISTLIFSLFYYLLKIGHPHEDAYILFIYAENFVKSGEFSYFLGGPPTEGATDFLWLIFITLFHWIGMSTGAAAALINAISAGGVFYLLNKLVEKHANHNVSISRLLTISLLVILSPVFASSLGGFSVYFYSFALLFIFYALSCFKVQNMVYIPLIGIIIGLIRPDGVIIGVTATFCTLYYLFQYNRIYFQKYLIITLISFIIGVIYFVSRYTYFGELLPLPIYVKSSQNEILPGAYTLFKWLGKVFPFIITTILVLFAKKSVRLRISIIPYVLLLSIFCFFVQSQNIAHRFQNATYFVFASYFLVFLYSEYKFHPRILKSIKFIFLVATLFIGSKYINKEWNKLTQYSYINSFSYHLKNEIKSKEIISFITEAGRYAYWWNHKAYDLIGLNFSETAKNGPTLGIFKKHEPDIIFFHHAGSINNGKSCSKDYEMISYNDLSIMRNEVSFTWNAQPHNVLKAPGASLDYIAQNQDKYTIIMACYMNSHTHIYAYKNDTITHEEFKKALEKSYADTRSYLDILKARDG